MSFALVAPSSREVGRVVRINFSFLRRSQKMCTTMTESWGDHVTDRDHIESLQRRLGMDPRSDSLLTDRFLANSAGPAYVTVYDVAHELAIVDYVYKHTLYGETIEDVMRACANRIKAQHTQLAWGTVWEIVREYVPSMLKIHMMRRMGKAVVPLCSELKRGETGTAADPPLRDLVHFEEVVDDLDDADDPHATRDVVGVRVHEVRHSHARAQQCVLDARTPLAHHVGTGGVVAHGLAGVGHVRTSRSDRVVHSLQGAVAPLAIPPSPHASQWSGRVDGERVPRV